MNAALVTLSLAGQQTSHAATDLNMFLDSVIKASKNSTNAAAVEAKQLGIEYNTTALASMGLAKFIQEITDKAGGNEDALAKLVPDVRGFRAIAVLAGSGADTFSKTLDDMTNKTGAADEAFQKNVDTLNNDWILAWNNMNASVIEGAQTNMPAMQKAVEGLTKDLQDNSPEVTDAAKNFSDLSAKGLQSVIDIAPVVIKAIDDISKALDFAATHAKSFVDLLPHVKQFELLGSVIDHLSPSPQQPPPDDQLWEVRPPDVDPGASPPGSPGSAGGGDSSSTKAASSALSNSKQVLQDMATIEKDILKSYDDEAKKNKERMDDLKTELELKQKMGIITPEETLELMRINSLVAYQKNAIQDATKAWQDQQTVVDDLAKKVDGIQQKIKDVYTSLQQTLSNIDDDTQKSLTDTIRNMMDTKKALETKLAEGSGLSQEEQDQLQTLTDQLAQAKAGTPDDKTAQQLALLGEQRNNLQQNGKLSPDQQAKLNSVNQQIQTLQSTQVPYDEAQKESQMSPLELIQYQAQQKKVEAAQDANSQTETLTGQLAQAQSDVSQAQDMLKTKIKAVQDAQTAQQQSITSSYGAIEKATASHVAAQIAKLDEEKAHVDALAASYSNVAHYISDPLGIGTGSSTAKTSALTGFADGGMINGPGTGTSDSIIARLSNGEYVMPAAATSVYRPILEAMRTMSFNLPRFATGGPVSSVKHDRRVSLVQHFHGDAANVMSRPDLLRWHLRLAEHLR
jgi:hypothetical protein